MNESYRLLLLLLGSLISAHAVAQSSITHNGLLELDYSLARQSGIQETDTVTLLATVFLEEIDHSNAPPNQAAFLQRASSLTVSWSDLDADFGSLGSAGGEVAFLDLQYIMASHWIVGGGFSKFRLSTLAKQATHTLEFGRYLNDTSTILATFARTEDRTSLLPASDARTRGLEYKSVARHPTANTSLTLDLKYNHVDANAGNSNILGVQGEYHFTLASSVLAGAEITNGEGKGQKYNLGLTHYTTRSFAIGGGFSHDRLDQQQDINAIEVYARLLF